MIEVTIDLDQHRGMAAQKATDLRRRRNFAAAATEIPQRSSLPPGSMLAPIALLPSQHAPLQSPLAKLVALHSEPTIPAALS